MSSHETRKDPARPATRSNYVATPAVNPLRNIMLPQGLQEADPLGYDHPRVLESSRKPNDRDTELLKGARDAGPPGGWVDDPSTPNQKWDTEVPQGPRDASPSGSRHPWIDELLGLQQNWDTVKPSGSRDAGPSSSQHSGVDVTPRPPMLESPNLNKTP